MWYQKLPSVERVVRRALVAAPILLVTGATAVAQSQTSSPATSPSNAPAGELRTFELAKPVSTQDAVQPRELPIAPARPPQPRESLRTMIGVGYVQGADWGSEILAGGSVAGAQVQLNALVTSGREGLLFDAGSLSIFDPNTKWRVEAGDVFSHLRGAARGGRMSWSARFNRRPAIAVYAPRRGTVARDTVVTYRDQLQVRGQTLLDAEIASDRSYLLRNRLAISTLEIETFYRRQRRPFESRDLSVSAGVTLWRGIGVSGGVFTSNEEGERDEWRMLSVRVPVARGFDLTLERAFAGSGETSQTTTAAMANIAAGGLRFFHRYQVGEYDFSGGGFGGSVERQQIRSMTTYSAGPRLNVTLQLATQRADTGRVEHWEELQATMKLTRTTTLRTVTGVPDVRNRERLQAYLRQELPRRFAVQADYGRISAYQSIARELDRSRLKVMLFKTVDLTTPARGATVTGRVVDDAGRGVAGARVNLGPYTADTDAGGAYTFAHVPRGNYELSLDPTLLPADYAWDRRGVPVTVASARTITAVLRVAPLNAIHGRVYVDRNGNGRFDAGEAIARAVLALGDRITASDADGAYSFHNLWPATYTVTLRSVPPGYLATTTNLTVTLLDGGPVTGADFRVLVQDKPIIWGAPGK